MVLNLEYQNLKSSINLTTTQENRLDLDYPLIEDQKIRRISSSLQVRTVHKRDDDQTYKHATLNQEMQKHNDEILSYTTNLEHQL